MIDLALRGDPGQCRRAAEALGHQRRQVADTAAELGHAVTRITRGWQGATGENTRGLLRELSGHAETLERGIHRFVDTLEEFATTLLQVQSELDQVRTQASRAGLLIDGDRIHEPDNTPTDPPAPLPVHPMAAALPDADRRRVVYRDCQYRVEDARRRERQAHQHLEEVTTDLTRAPFLQRWLTKSGILPTETTTTGLSLWAGDKTLLAAGTTADWETRVKYGELRPTVNGLPVSADDLPSSQRYLLGLHESNWRARPEMEVPRAGWLKAGKLLGQAGGGLAVVASAWDQWREDADDPATSGGEHVARTVVEGVAGGAGAYGGAVAGAEVLGAVGTAICPGVGTVIGGAIGGLIGGAGGTWAGEQLGNLAKGLTHKLFHW